MNGPRRHDHHTHRLTLIRIHRRPEGSQVRHSSGAAGSGSDRKSGCGTPCGRRHRHRAQSAALRLCRENQQVRSADGNSAAGTTPGPRNRLGHQRQLFLVRSGLLPAYPRVRTARRACAGRGSPQYKAHCLGHGHLRRHGHRHARLGGARASHSKWRWRCLLYSCSTSLRSLPFPRWARCST